MRNSINIWFVNMNWIMLLDNIYVDYYPCYDKVWSIVKSEFLIWTSIYFELNSELIAPHLIDVMSWALRYEYVCLIMIMNLWYVSQNTHANRVVLVCAHRIWTLVGRGSHQPVWTDHPTVRSLMLIAFWFSDELYHLIFLLWPIWETFL